VAPGVWVDYTRRPTASAHPADVRAASGLPRWRRREMLAGRALLRALLADVAPAAAGAELVPAVNGKPVLGGWPRVGVSVSHDRDAVAAAVALDRPVGVDVQLPPDRISDLVIRRCLRERAADLIALPPANRATEFAWVWSVQESCVKADGSGMSGRPWAIDVPLRPRSGWWRDLTWIALRDHTDVPVSCAFGEPTC
jgi:4'-phosphopantetheinyl transferase